MLTAEVATQMSFRDFAIGARALRRHPAFTITAVLTLALVESARDGRVVTLAT